MAELTRKGIQDRLDRKLAEIQELHPEQQLNVTKSTKAAVIQQLATRMNADLTLDQRCKIANEHVHLTGVTRSEVQSPQLAAAANAEYVPKQAEKLCNDYQFLLSKLIEYGVMRKERQVSVMPEEMSDVLELCRELDEATAAILQEKMPYGSITTAELVYEKLDVTRMYEASLEVFARHKALMEVGNLNQMMDEDLQIWRKHMAIMASFGALAVALKKLLG